MNISDNEGLPDREELRLFMEKKYGRDRKEAGQAMGHLLIPLLFLIFAGKRMMGRGRRGIMTE